MGVSVVEDNVAVLELKIQFSPIILLALSIKRKYTCALIRCWKYKILETLCVSNNMNHFKYYISICKDKKEYDVGREKKLYRPVYMDI